MKISLLSPAGAMHRYNGSFGKSLHYAPLTLTTLAALVPDDVEVEELTIYDETVTTIPHDLDADLIGITVITGTAPRSYKWADYFRSRGATVVLGGVHPSILPYEAMEHADCVVTGFADNTFPQLIRDFASNRLKPLYTQELDYTMGDGIRPRRDLLNKKDFITVNTIEVTKGCANHCTFCAFPAAFGKNSDYQRNIRPAIEEIESMKSKEILFPDINLISNKEFAKAFFREMIPLKKWWLGLATSDIMEDEELFDIIVKSGCKGLLIGFESVDRNSLKRMGKSFNQIEYYKKLVKRLHDNGIGINGTFAFGSDGEDKSVFEETVRVVNEMKIDLPRYSIVTPYPNTPFYRQLEQEGRIIERDWTMYDVEHSVFKPDKMSPGELEEGLEYAWRLTYKTTSIIRRLTSFKTLFPIFYLANFGYKSYAKKLNYFTKSVMIDNSDIPDVPADRIKKEKSHIPN
jgi:radical SAM superfamily enzyme YgiQ (UPF0313 family)